VFKGWDATTGNNPAGVERMRRNTPTEKRARVRLLQEDFGFSRAEALEYMHDVEGSQ